ncbi:MAG: kynureninase [Anaerolineales bacterium]|nr:kynureninase [Anaerolineales bacterium]
MAQLDAAYAYSLDAKDELSLYKDRFVSKDPELIYLDGNSLGRLPRATTGRVQTLVEQEWGGRLIRGWGEGWFEMASRVGDKIAKIIGAQPGEVIVSDSTTVNLYKLALSALMALPNRSKIITDDLNFPSDVYVMQGLVDTLPGRTLHVVNSPDQIHGPINALRASLDENTALLTLTHTTFKSGYTYDLAAVSALAHEVGALTLWDFSHSAGSVPINVTDAKVDLAVGCCYKYLNGGPGAPAFLYVRKNLQERLKNPITGWFSQKNMFGFDLEYQPVSNIRRFMVGTPTVLSMAAVEVGVDMLVEATMEKIRAKSVQQTEYFIALYKEILQPLGFRLNTPTDPTIRGSHVSIGHDEGWRIDQALINDANVIPDFRAPDNIRLGFAPLYTSFVDIHTAVMRLRNVVTEKLYEKYSNDRSAVT